MAKLWVGNLSLETNNTTLTAAFEKFGELKLCYVVLKNKRSLHYGFVTYEKPEDADKAMAALSGTTLDGNEIKIEKSDSPEPSEREAPKERAPRKKKEPNTTEPVDRGPQVEGGGDGAKIYVGQLPLSVNNGALRESFEEFGAIAACYVVYQNRRSRGFGFVEYSTEAEAQKAIEAMNGTTLSGKDIEVSLATGRSDEAPARKSAAPEAKEKAPKKKKEKKPTETNTTERVDRGPKVEGGGDGAKIYVGQLPLSMNNGALRENFEKFGAIAACYVVYQNRRSRGFGFVEYATEAEAQKAIEAMNGTTLSSKGKDSEIEVSLASSSTKASAE